MTDQQGEPGRREQPSEGVSEGEMDRERLGEGLGDTVDGRDVADLGRPEAETARPAAPSVTHGVFTDHARRGDAGAIEDEMAADGAESDEIEAQDATGSGGSGL